MAKYMGSSTASPLHSHAHSNRIGTNVAHNCSSHHDSAGSDSLCGECKLNDESSSSRSSKLNSQRSGMNDSESLNEGLKEFQLSQIPVNSFDGMQEAAY